MRVDVKALVDLSEHLEGRRISTQGSEQFRHLDVLLHQTVRNTGRRSKCTAPLRELRAAPRCYLPQAPTSCPDIAVMYWIFSIGQPTGVAVEGLPACTVVLASESPTLCTRHQPRVLSNRCTPYASTMCCATVTLSQLFGCIRVISVLMSVARPLFQSAPRRSASSPLRTIIAIG
jgi:hypothetical protein